MTLIIQTNLDDRVDVWVATPTGGIVHKTQSQTFEDRATPLVLVDQALRATKLPLKKLQRIIVTRGPGRFSSVRTGLLIANTLSQELHLPVTGVIAPLLLTPQKIAVLLATKPPSKISPVRPWYGKAPNIGRPKKRR